jgi:hypothetical protein
VNRFVLYVGKTAWDNSWSKEHEIALAKEYINYRLPESRVNRIAILDRKTGESFYVMRTRCPHCEGVYGPAHRLGACVKKKE